MWLFTSIYRVANTLANARDAVRGVADRRTEAVAAYFERIAATTEEMQRLLAEHRAPHEQVARLRTCAADFVGIVGGLLPDEQVQLMAEDLIEFQSAEELLRIYHHPDYGRAVALEISEAIGIFRGLADSLRARV